MAFKFIMGATCTCLVAVSYYETSLIRMINTSSFKYFVEDEWRI